MGRKNPTSRAPIPGEKPRYSDTTPKRNPKERASKNETSPISSSYWLTRLISLGPKYLPKTNAAPKRRIAFPAMKTRLEAWN